MKEPVPDENGIVRIRTCKFTVADIAAFKARGFCWNEEREIYELDYDKYKEENKYKGSKLEPMSFQPDNFHRAIHKGYGGDCL